MAGNMGEYMDTLVRTRGTALVSRFDSYQYISLGERYMRKVIAGIVFVLLLPAAAFSEGTTLYDISAQTLNIVEATAACANHDSACTEEDVEALKLEMVSRRHDLASLIKSGDLRAMMFSREEMEAFAAQSKDVSERFSNIQILDGPCNMAIRLVSLSLHLLLLMPQAWLYLDFFLNYLLFSPEVVFIANIVAGIIFVPLMGVFTMVTLLSLPTLLVCLFWWL